MLSFARHMRDSPAGAGFAKTLLDGQASLRLARVCASLRHDWANLEPVELAEMPRARDPAAELEHEGHRPRKNEDRVVRERSDLERDRTAINSQPSLGAPWELCAIEELARTRLEAIISSLCTIDMSITKVHARQVPPCSLYARKTRPPTLCTHRSSIPAATPPSRSTSTLLKVRGPFPEFG